MSPRPRSTGRALVAVPVVLLALAAAAPAASARTTLKLALPAQADAGARVPFTYTTKGLPRHGKLVVQRKQGTAGVWKTLKTVKRARSGSATLPPLAADRYTLRLAVVSGRRSSARSGRRFLGVFATVPLGEVFGRAAATVNVPTRAFSYVLSGGAYGDKGTTDVLTVPASKNVCRSIHLDWTTSGDAPPEDAALPTLTVLRQSADPVASQVPFQTISAIDAPLVPGESWSITQSHGGTFAYVGFYLNGTASCTNAIDLG